MSTDGFVGFHMDGPFRWNRQPKLVFYEVQRNREYKISVNVAMLLLVQVNSWKTVSDCHFLLKPQRVRADKLAG